MLGFLKKLRPSSSQAPPQTTVPSGTRVYAIGDIHGRLDLLENLHTQISKDARTANERRNIIVYLGDYIDRGLDSRGVVNQLTGSTLPQFDSVHLKGNHEAMLLEFLENASIGPQWMAIGGKATLLSYGVDLHGAGSTEAGFAEVQEKLKRNLPSKHIAFLKSLKLQYTVGDYHFVHAGVRPGRPLAEQEERDLIWIRGLFLRSKAWHGKMIVHGHSIERKPEVFNNRIGIDTAAYASGRLTCLVLSKDQRAFLFAES